MNSILKKTETIYQVLYSFITRNINSQVLLDEFIESATLADDYSFDTGLLGAGWLIAYLDNKELIKIDINDVLYDLDDNIYKVTLRTVTNSSTKIDQIMELITYYHERLLKRNIHDRFYRSIILDECLKLLVDKLSFILSESTFSAEIITKVILKWSYLNMYCTNKIEIEKELYKNMKNLIDYYTDMKEDFSETDIISLYYLLLSAKQYTNFYWISCIERLLKRYSLNTPISKALNTISRNSLNSINLLTCENIEKIKDKNVFVFILVSNLKDIKVI